MLTIVKENFVLLTTNCIVFFFSAGIIFRSWTRDSVLHESSDLLINEQSKQWIPQSDAEGCKLILEFLICSSVVPQFFWMHFHFSTEESFSPVPKHHMNAAWVPDRSHSSRPYVHSTFGFYQLIRSSCDHKVDTLKSVSNSQPVNVKLFIITF